MSADEIWKAIPEYRADYEVSNLGRVRSLDRLVSHGVGNFQRKRKGTILKPGTVKSGHQLVVLGRGHSRLIHRLVLEAFVGPRPDGMECCHGDGDPANNCLNNLRWDTRSANVLDDYKHGVRKRIFPKRASA